MALIWSPLRGKTDAEDLPAMDLAKRETWKMLPWILLAAFGVRAIVALLTDSIVHSDELYQYLEQGHRLVFGNGWIPWEYAHGLRSWIIPLAIACVLKPFELLGLDSPYIYQPAIKLILCAISLVLPLSMYRIAQALFSQRAARLALIFGCFWYEIVSYAHRPLADVLSTYSLFAALALVLEPPRRQPRIWAGALAALTVLLRFQQLPIVAIVGLAGLFRWREKAWVSALSFLATMILGGALDAYTWGVWFASITVNIDYNLTQDLSSHFGVSPGFFYLYGLVAASTGLCLFGVAGLGLSWRRSWLLIAVGAMTLIFFSLIGHKEARFIFPIVPIWLIGLALLIADERFQQLLRSGWTQPVAVAAVMLLSLAGINMMLPRQQLGASTPIAQSDSRRAFRYLSAQRDVTAVIDNVDALPFTVGGYYDLHLDVPLYFAEISSRGGDEARSDPARYASHVLAPAAAPGPPGFSRLTQIGNVAVWRRNIDPHENAVPVDYDRRIKMDFQEPPPKVKPRW